LNLKELVTVGVGINYTVIANNTFTEHVIKITLISKCNTYEIM